MIKEDAERRHIESLLPWYAAGTLGRSDADRVEQALAGAIELARCYALVLDERAETINVGPAGGFVACSEHYPQCRPRQASL